MSKPPAALVEQLQGFLAQLNEADVALYEVAAAAFLVREQAYWTLLARDPHLTESRFAQFLAAPAAYALVESLIDEDAPAMSAGAGGVAGIGIGPQGEPGVNLPRKRRVDEAACTHDWVAASYASDGGKQRMHCTKCGTSSTVSGIERGAQLAAGQRQIDVRWTYARGHEEGRDDKRKGIQAGGPYDLAHLLKRYQLDWARGYRDGWSGITLREATKGPDETFAGADVFNVPTDKFMTSRFGKNRYHQYSRYVGKDAVGESIRQHGRKSRKRDIVLKDQATGAMIWLLRRKKAA